MEGEAVTTDLSSRIAELAALIEAEAAEDERIAMATIDINVRVAMRRGKPAPRWIPEDGGSGIRSEDNYQILRVKHTWAAERDHIIRQDPASTLRRVKAVRELVAAILTEPHQHVEGDAWYSCSQAVSPHLDPEDEDYGRPGSGCTDDTRAGQPCDCGRDQRVARLLSIVASEWEDL